MIKIHPDNIYQKQSYIQDLQQYKSRSLVNIKMANNEILLLMVQDDNFFKTLASNQAFREGKSATQEELSAYQFWVNFLEPLKSYIQISGSTCSNWIEHNR